MQIGAQQRVSFNGVADPQHDRPRNRLETGRCELWRIATKPAAATATPLRQEEWRSAVHRGIRFDVPRTTRVTWTPRVPSESRRLHYARGVRFRTGPSYHRYEANGMTHYPNPLRTRRRGAKACIAIHAVCGLVYLEATLAQEPGRVTIDAQRCLELESPDERLACFETQVDEAESRGSTAPATAGAPTPSSQQSIPTVDVAALPGQGAAADAPGQSEWVGNITSLREREPNQHVITLDSGQVWQQRGTERYPLRVGQRVRIHETRFGLRLQADGVNRYIPVERIQ